MMDYFTPARDDRLIGQIFFMQNLYSKCILQKDNIPEPQVTPVYSRFQEGLMWTDDVVLFAG